MDKVRFIGFLDLAVLFFLGLHVITSQLSVALSSIGLGGLIITGTVRLFYGKFYKPGSVLLWLFFILIAFKIISSVFSADPAKSFELSKRILLYFSFFYTIIFIKSREQLKYIFYSLLIFTFIVCVIELFRYFQSGVYLQNPQFSETRLHEFGHSITNGEIKMLLLIIFISMLFTRENFGIPKIVNIIAIVPLLLSFYLTNTRGAFLGFFAGAITIGILKDKRFLLAFILIVGLFLLFAPFTYKERVLSITDPTHPTNAIRLTMWNVGLKIIKDHPLTGIGDVDLQPVYEQYKKIEMPGEASHMHNNILEMAVELGIPGLLSWIVLMLYIFIRYIKIFKLTMYDNELNVLVVISIASFIAMQVSGLTEYNFGDFEFSAVLWFALAIGLLADKLVNLKDYSNS